MNPDKDLFDLIIELIEKVLGRPVSPLFEKALAAFFILTIVAAAANALILGIKTLINEVIIPVFYNKEQKRRRSRRQLFADHIESEIRRLNTLEAWSDNRFTELEAEVEAEGQRLLFGILPIVTFKIARPRIEKSLSRALEQSGERLILLEGEPGSGKSVALRHLTQLLAVKTRNSKNNKSLIPLYVNLRDLKPKDGELVNRILIEKYILNTVNRVNDRDVAEFLDDEFQKGLEERSWLFLFDSFDEIPAILNSTESDETTRLYAEAIRDFLHGMNQCRGIVASREYRGPKILGWPKFRILQLSPERRKSLIVRAGLTLKKQTEVLQSLRVASSDFMVMTSNPMFLGILCEFIKDHTNVELPSHTHTVFDFYINLRLNRDRDRLMQRYNIDPKQVRGEAEKVAFCMNSSPEIGLSPERIQLKNAAKKAKIQIKNIDKYLDALEFIKLGRAEMTGMDKERKFTFAHRRFQEFFATQFLLRNPNKVAAENLLLEAQWRESTVVLLQNQPSADNKYILDVAGVLLQERFSELQQSQITDLGIKWPKNLLHIMGLLQDGFIGNTSNVSESIRKIYTSITSKVFTIGLLPDKKWVLEVSSLAEDSDFINLLVSNFNSTSRLLSDIAYRQASKLKRLTNELVAVLARMMLYKSLQGKLLSEWQDINFQIQKFDRNRELKDILWLTTLLPPVNVILVVMTCYIGLISLPYSLGNFVIATVFFLVLYMDKALLQRSWIMKQLERERSGFASSISTELLGNSPAQSIGIILPIGLLLYFGGWNLRQWSTIMVVALLVLLNLWYFKAMEHAFYATRTAPKYWLFYLIEILSNYIMNFWGYLRKYFSKNLKQTKKKASFKKKLKDMATSRSLWLFILQNLFLIPVYFIEKLFPNMPPYIRSLLIVGYGLLLPLLFRGFLPENSDRKRKSFGEELSDLLTGILSIFGEITSPINSLVKSSAIYSREVNKTRRQLRVEELEQIYGSIESSSIRLRYLETVRKENILKVKSESEMLYFRRLIKKTEKIEPKDSDELCKLYEQTTREFENR